jgi:hypothetical protein
LIAAILAVMSVAGVAMGWKAWDAKAAMSPGAPSAAEARHFILQEESTPYQAVEAKDLMGSAETRLFAAYRLVGQQRLDAALQVSTALVKAYPNFKLGLLLHADLLAAHARPLTRFGVSGPGPASPVAAEALSGLRDEAVARLRGMAERPPEGAVPTEFVRLPSSTPFVIAVDAKRSRLYLFGNEGGRLRLIDDFYVSVGKQGVDKRAEGDQKTPLGVYHTSGRVEADRLDERFGVGAVSLNYPNAYDRNVGRTGSGILLHGVPTSTYTRPPLDSDGCVVMSNDDLLRLAEMLPERNTPVLITRELHWTPADTQPRVSVAFNAAWASWQAARLQGNTERMERLYQSDATLAATGKAAIRFQKRLALAPASLEEVSILTWHDEAPTMVVTFLERGASDGKRNQWVRQYWHADAAGAWRIVAEGPVG